MHVTGFEEPMSKQEIQPSADRGGFLALAALAATLGASAAILFAPEEGTKTRKRVSRRLQSLSGEAADRITSLQRELQRRRYRAEREKRLAALTGFLVGAGLTALLTTQGGSSARRRLGDTLSRMKVGAVDRIERLRQDSNSSTRQPGSNEETVRSVQELGRDANSVF
jgi:hypothetical protein